MGALTVLLVAAAALSARLAAAAAPPLFASIFSSHAVLQRDAATRVWGFAAASVGVDVQFAGSTYSARADASGAWSLTLPATAAGGPYELAANASDGRAQTITDVLFGEVRS